MLSGRLEKTIYLAKTDIVPTDSTLFPEYVDFAQVEAACAAFMDKVNLEVHSVTLEIMAQMLENTERATLHRVPEKPFALAIGHSRVVPPNTPIVQFEKSSYSVPYRLMGQQSVWVREAGADHIVIIHIGDHGEVEVARPTRTRPRVPSVQDTHFPRPLVLCAGNLIQEMMPNSYPWRLVKEPNLGSKKPPTLGWIKSGREWQPLLKSPNS